ncbi:MAG: GxxExxY protein [Candidatus Margulisiibacteriota bacterium]
MAELLYKDLSYKLNGIFFEVQNKLGTKFQEKHYLKAICSLLKEQKVPFKTEVSFKLNFNNELLGSFRADMIVDDKILIELKAVDRLTNDHKLQILRYLQALNLELALLVNFRLRPLQIIRVIRGVKSH